MPRSKLLKSKKEEHGDWKYNKQAFERLFFAASQSHDESGKCLDFEFRPDFAEIVAILQKLSRILTKHGKPNPDDWKDICGYSLLRYNELEKKNLDIDR